MQGVKHLVLGNFYILLTWGREVQANVTKGEQE